MTDSENLTALLMAGAVDCLGKGGTLNCSKLADYLLANGVIVLPCKVGDTVYHVFPKKGIQTNTVRQIRIGSCGKNIFDFYGLFEPSDFGKTVFLTLEEAEKALKEREQ